MSKTTPPRGQHLYRYRTGELGGGASVCSDLSEQGGPGSVNNCVHLNFMLTDTSLGDRER